MTTPRPPALRRRRWPLLAAHAVLLLASLPAVAGSPAPVVKVGSKGFTEGVVLGELLAAVGRHAGAVVEHKAALGGTQIVFQALEKGDIDCYVEYTGTLTQEILRAERIRSLEQAREALARRGLVMMEPLGFNNTYALGMKESVAAALGIDTISDLAARAAEPEIAALAFGFSDEFVKRGDGWPAVRDAYRLEQQPQVLDHSLAYRGIETGHIDVTDLYSTDPEIRYYGLRLLADDRGAFREYKAFVLCRADLATRAPQFVRELERLAGSIGNADMLEMNARVRLDGEPERAVAARFLRNRFGWEIDTEEPTAAVRIVGDLLRATRQHLLLVFVSLLAAIVVGVPLGVYASLRPRLAQAILGAVGIIQTIPSMAVLVFMVPLLGLGWRPAAAALFLYSLLPIVRGTFNGLAEIPAHLRESAEVLGLDRWARLWLVELPMASRSILSGIKTAAVINVGTATIGGLIGAGGYGEAILSGIRRADPAQLMQGAVPAAALALILQAAFELLERFVVPAGMRGHGRS